MSTLAAQIAAVKRAVWCYESGAAASPATAHVLADLRDAVATLEGMAAPGETTRYPSAATAAKMAYWSGDSPSPQQPTQEARRLVQRIQNCGMGSSGELEFQLSETKAATEIDRFAAQRVTAALTAKPCGDDYAEARRIIDRAETAFQESVGSKIVRFNSDAFACFQQEIAAALTAATDKARREIVAYLRNPDGDIYQRALRLGVLVTLHDIADWIESTPQNPGDAAGG